MTDLLPVADAQKRVLALAEPLSKETVAIDDAAGRWLAADLIAQRTQPAVDLSAMDGYAVRFDNLPGPLSVVGESAAGSAYTKALQDGQAIRIFTGAPVPKGADTVMMQEDAERDGDILQMTGDGPPGKGSHIRKKGGDFANGDVLLKAGEQITPPALGLAISGGHGVLEVRRKPKIAILSTGDELVAPGEHTNEAQIPASNGPMLAARLACLPVTLETYPIIRDTREALSAAIDQAHEADIIVTIGGASVGDYDLVMPILKDMGAEFDFWKVAMKPGKPVMAGKLDNAVTLGLPGNPSSAYVSARLFLEPLITHMSGASKPLPQFQTAMLDGDLPATGRREEYVRGRWIDGRVRTLDQQSSAALVALARADVLIRRAPFTAAAQGGDTVEILSLT